MIQGYISENMSSCAVLVLLVSKKKKGLGGCVLIVKLSMILW
jgi:hypothetical protein